MRVSRPIPRGRAGPIVLAGLSLLVAVACGRQEVPYPASDSASIGVSLPKPGDGRMGISAVLNSLTLESPLSIGWDGRPGKRAIDDWRWEDDGLTLRLHLRPDVTFHNGAVLTNAIVAEIIRSGLSGFLSSSVQSVKAEGTDWIVIRSARREGFLLSDISTLNFSLPGADNVGFGPFVLESRNPIRLRAFDKYRLGAPGLRSLRINEYDTQRAAWAAMMRGDVDILYDVSSDAVEFINAESAINTYSSARAYYNFLAINFQHPILSRAEVRRALNEAVDREEIVRFALKGKGRPAVGPVWPHHWAFDQSVDASFRFSPEAAAARLDAAGLPPINRGPGRMPSRFSFECLIVEEDQQLERLALVLQKQLFDIGVDMQLRALPLKQVMAQVTEQRYDAALTQFAGSRSLSFTYFWHSPQPGQPAMFNADYTGADEALDSLRAAITDAELAEAVPRVQRAFVDDPPVIFLDWMETARAIRRSISVPADPGRDVLGSIHSWRPVAGELSSR